MNSFASQNQRSFVRNDHSFFKSVVIPWTVIISLACLGTFLVISSSEDDTPILQEMKHGDDNNMQNNSNNTSIYDSMHAIISDVATDVATDHPSLKHHKPLLPLTFTDFRGFFYAIIGLMLAAGGGIGGGGILVPIYILVMGFTPKHAIPLSNVTVFGGAIANTLMNWSKRHPLADRPLIDWDLLLIMEPLTIAGALIGVFLNKVLPEQVLTVMLVLLLSFTAYNTFQKALKMYNKETAQFEEQTKKSAKSSSLGKESEKLLDSSKDVDYATIPSSSIPPMDVELAQQDSEEGSDKTSDTELDEDIQEMEIRTKILDEEKKVPIGKISSLFFMFIVVLFMNLMKGGGAFRSPIGIKCGSTSFWTANIIMLAFVSMVSLFARSYLVIRHNLKESCGYPYVEGDIKWTARATVLYPLICALAGFFAGMFGIGGGIVKGPLMLAMGVHPKVASATSACMILFTSFTATSSFVVFGLLIPDYAIVCLVIGFVATYFGQVVLNHLMNYYQRNSYIAFSIGSVVLLSAVLMTIQSAMSMIEGHSGLSGGICHGGSVST